MSAKRHTPWLLSLILFLAIAFPCFAENSINASWQGEGPHIKVALISEKNGLRPGATQMLAIRMSPETDWHTYWRNPGDSGEAPRVDMSSNARLEFGDLLWPTPEVIPVAHLANYGYSNEHLLLVDVTTPKDTTIGQTVSITADLSWLVCKEDCIPGWATLTLSLPVTERPGPTEFADQFSQTRSNLPSKREVNARFEVSENHIALQFAGEERDGWYAFPFRSDLIDHAAAQQQVFANGTVNVLMARSAYFSGNPTSANFLLSNGTDAFYVDAALASSDAQSSETSFYGVLILLGSAFLGGLILNIMPCVLPILSIKALALRQHTQLLSHKLAYLLGVLVCFNAFAIIVMILQQGTEQLGWGFHMQSPTVIWLLAFLFTFIGLVLLDVFIVGSKMAGIGESLVTGNTAKSHFFTGLLAVVVASPCTAPFMAAALGVALVSEPLLSLAIFNVLAVGFALPLTLVFASSTLQRCIPSPGAWMQTFKHILAFPMFATTAWLVWVFAGQQGLVAQFVLMLALVFFSFCAFMSDKTQRSMRAVFMASMLVCIVLPLLNVLPIADDNNTNLAIATSQKNYDPAMLDALKREQQVVLVNMTADWCITCKVNEQVALNTTSVKQALSDDDVHYVIGDWTRKDDEILQYLRQYERAGVPLYVVYSGTQNHQVLPQVLTPGIVVDAIDNAKEELSNVN
ncbi:MAG: thioredoxin family protein [Pseudomonadota bacterium]